MLKGEYAPRYEVERSWKTEAMYVDLRPVRTYLLHGTALRTGRAEYFGSKGSKEHVYKMGPRDQQNAIGLVGEVAAGLLVGSYAPELKESNAPDLRLRSGQRRMEVKTCKWSGSDKWPPQMLANRKGRHAWKNEQYETIWCVTRPFPECFDGAWVVGYIEPETYMRVRQPGTGRVDWAYVVPWVDDGRWIHIGEVMNDELARPWLPVGTPGRRYDDDPGLAAFDA